MRENVLGHEPDMALFVTDEDPLVFYKAIARWSERFLAPEGFCITEINEHLGVQTRKVFQEAGFSNTEILQDLFDKDRFVAYSR